jgi:hypothetical protein
VAAFEAARKAPGWFRQGDQCAGMAAATIPIPRSSLNPAACYADTCEVIEERWANWLRQDPVVASKPGGQSPPAEGVYIDCGERISSICFTVLADLCAAERARYCTSLRGVPRQPCRRRLSDGASLPFSRRRYPADLQHPDQAALSLRQRSRQVERIFASQGMGGNVQGDG